MFPQIKHWPLVLGALSTVTMMTPLAPPAAAQGWRDGGSCRGLDGRDRARCERAADRRDDRWDRQRNRERRKDAKTDGIVAGVVGTAILGGIIAAAASSGKKKNDRREQCDDRYGDYDEQNDSYRASDGRWYPCA